eukprot:CAMPEP_0119142052 /NCGR_PEP_ID=MMETSP1310-20130426/32021_1 /TAXON_ID=464262 /ORGANISM="Genus nov. species nov., Strain RCC2339" /LENGTH=97 /DNA_ID=CAMNT_0007133563 /DNA_START=187 /DNA_END=480 /DNA_ORIENTATION=-
MPGPMSEMADSFVRSEFKDHKGIQDRRLVVNFMEEWFKYLKTIEAQSGAVIGRNLDEDELGVLTDDQAMRMVSLRDSIADAAGALRARAARERDEDH